MGSPACFLVKYALSVLVEVKDKTKPIPLHVSNLAPIPLKKGIQRLKGRSEKQSTPSIHFLKSPITLD